MMCFGYGSYYLKSCFSACLKAQNLSPSWCVKAVNILVKAYLMTPVSCQFNGLDGRVKIKKAEEKNMDLILILIR